MALGSAVGRTGGGLGGNTGENSALGDDGAKARKAAAFARAAAREQPPEHRDTGRRAVASRRGPATPEREEGGR